MIYIIGSDVAVELQWHKFEVVVARSVNYINDSDVAQHVLCKESKDFIRFSDMYYRLRCHIIALVAPVRNSRSAFGQFHKRSRCSTAHPV